jgi:hypothetical protein
MEPAAEVSVAGSLLHSTSFALVLQGVLGEGLLPVASRERAAVCDEVASPPGGDGR